MPDGTLPFPEPMLTYHQWVHVALTSDQFHGSKDINLLNQFRHTRVNLLQCLLKANEFIWNKLSYNMWVKGFTKSSLV